jgi:hypothetical protein
MKKGKSNLFAESKKRVNFQQYKNLQDERKAEHMLLSQMLTCCLAEDWSENCKFSPSLWDKLSKEEFEGHMVWNSFISVLFKNRRLVEIFRNILKYFEIFPSSSYF